MCLHGLFIGTVFLLKLGKMEFYSVKSLSSRDESGQLAINPSLVFSVEAVVTKLVAEGSFRASSETQRLLSSLQVCTMLGA